MAPATDMRGLEAVLVAHGSPSDPGPQDRAMADLAAAVAAHLPGMTVRGATLAGDGSLARALAGLHRPVVYPFFMAEGYFTTDILPARIAAAGHQARVLPAFGSDAALPGLIADAALSGAMAHALDPRQTILVLAAHGSQVSAASKLRTLDLTHRLAALTPFRRIVAGFIEEDPYLHDAAKGLESAICLPLFSLDAGHVREDVPEALARAAFRGVLLPRIGAHPAVPALIAASLARQASRVAA